MSIFIVDLVLQIYIFVTQNKRKKYPQVAGMGIADFKAKVVQFGEPEISLSKYFEEGGRGCLKTEIINNFFLKTLSCCAHLSRAMFY